MGDPACHLSSVCLSCGRYLESDDLSECPHCGEPIDYAEEMHSEIGPVIAVSHANTILYCEAFSSTVDFYRRRLRLEVIFSNEWFTEFALGERSSLSIVDASRATIPAVKGKGMTLSIKVEDLHSQRRRLVDLGIEPTPISRRFDSEVFDIYDPEGHRIEFWAE